MGFPPQDSQATPFDDDFVEGAISCFLCRGPRGECDKGTLLLGHHMDVANLTKLIKVVSQIFLSHGFVDSAHIERGDALVVWRGQLGHVRRLFEQLLGNRVVGAIVAVLEFLLGEGIVRVGGHLVSVGALLSSLALSLDPERADVWTVPLVVRSGPS